jgi:hypothetical protein
VVWLLAGPLAGREAAAAEAVSVVAARTEATGPLTAAPVDLAALREIIPLGNLNPHGGHVFPTDHVYFDYAGKPGLPVFAPTAGRVFAIRSQLAGDSKIEVRVDQHLSFYLAHVAVEPGVAVGSEVRAGQLLGYATGRSLLDLGAYDDRVRLRGFIDPSRYPSPTIQTVSPLALFSEPLRGQLYAKVTRQGADRDGKIDFDQPGRLVGNWFHESLSVSDSARGDARTWAKLLAFVYDVREPEAVRVSIGGAVAPAGAYAVQPGAPDPSQVSVESGLVRYELSRPGPHARSRSDADRGADERIGLLLVHLLDERTVKVEYFAGKTAAEVSEFSGAAHRYSR